MRIIHRERPSTKNAVTNVIYRRQLNGRAYLSDPDVFFLRSSNISLTDKQKDNLAKLDALLGGVFLTSDDPSAYTEKMKEQYRFYRHMTEAENVEVNASRTGTYVSWTLDGKEHGEYLF
jgi:alpha-galactosidase